MTIDGDVKVDATNTAKSEAKTSEISISIALIGLAASGSVANSTITPTTHASITGSDLSAGKVVIHSTATPRAQADAAGLTVSTGLAMGVSTVTVDLNGNVTAGFGSSGKTVNIGSLDVLGNLAQPTDEFSELSRFGKVFRCILRFGVSQGSRVEPGRTPKRLMELDVMNYPNLLDGFGQSICPGSGGWIVARFRFDVTSATNNMNVTASIANGSTLNVTGGTKVVALSNTKQEADASSFALGLIGTGRHRGDRIE